MLDAKEKDEALKDKYAYKSPEQVQNMLADEAAVLKATEEQG